MRSSSAVSSTSFRVPPQASKKKKKFEQFELGPVLYPDTTDTSRSSRINKSFTDQSPTPTGVDALTFRSPDSSSASARKSKKSVQKKKKGRETSSSNGKKASKRASRQPDETETDEEIEKEEIREQDLNREKSSYERKKRDKILKLAKKAEKAQEKLMLQRALTQQTTKEIESSMNIEQETRNRSMDMMKSQLEGLDWRSSRDIKDVRREIAEWKEKTAMSAQLAKRVDKIEKRVGALEKTDAERKKTIDLVEKNWSDFGRLKTQSMALELTQIRNRRGGPVKMPDDLAKTTAKNLYKLCADLSRFSYHINQKTDVARLADEALTLAEAIAPFYGSKDEFVDSREATSSTNVSISSESSVVSSGNRSAPTSPRKESASKPPRSEVSIPPLIKFDPKYSMKTNQYVDAPSLREKSSNYYSDYEVNKQFNKQQQANGELAPAAPQAVTTVPATPTAVAAPTEAAAAAAETTTPAAAAASPAVSEAAPAEAAASVPPPTPAAPPAAPVDAPPAAAAAAAAPADPSPASISLSVDSDPPKPVVKKKKSGSRRSSSEKKEEEAKPE